MGVTTIAVHGVRTCLTMLGMAMMDAPIMMQEVAGVGAELGGVFDFYIASVLGFVTVEVGRILGLGRLVLFVWQ